MSLLLLAFCHEPLRRSGRATMRREARVLQTPSRMKRRFITKSDRHKPRSSGKHPLGTRAPRRCSDSPDLICSAVGSRDHFGQKLRKRCPGSAVAAFAPLLLCGWNSAPAPAARRLSVELVDEMAHNAAARSDVAPFHERSPVCTLTTRRASRRGGDRDRKLLGPKEKQLRLHGRHKAAREDSDGCAPPPPQGTSRDGTGSPREASRSWSSSRFLSWHPRANRSRARDSARAGRGLPSRWSYGPKGRLRQPPHEATAKISRGCICVSFVVCLHHSSRSFLHCSLLRSFKDNQTRLRRALPCWKSRACCTTRPQTAPPLPRAPSQTPPRPAECQSRARPPRPPARTLSARE